MTSQVLPLLVRAAEQRSRAPGLARSLGLKEPLGSEVDVPLARLDALCDRCAGAAKDPLLAFHVASHLPRGAYGLLEFTARAAPTLQRALEAFIGFSPLLNDQIQLEWLPLPGGEWMLRHSVPGVPTAVGRHCNEFYLTALVELTRQMVGRRFRPERAAFAHRGELAGPVRASLGCPVELGRGANVLVYGAQWLERPLRESDAPLFAVLHQVAQRAALERPARFDLTSRVRAALAELLPKGGGSLLERVALRFRLGGRTLQRRLEGEGVRFFELLDQFRQEQALEWVRHGRLELSEISYRLGYAQPRAFFRAFRRWTGHSPMELRQ